uniref:Uncharacterized protein n=1 Tax=Caenorhabditis japonica TaxID=281687 RepID=A0A8R1EGU1_CAEJA
MRGKRKKTTNAKTIKQEPSDEDFQKSMKVQSVLLNIKLEPPSDDEKDGPDRGSSIPADASYLKNTDPAHFKSEPICNDFEYSSPSVVRTHNTKQVKTEKPLRRSIRLPKPVKSFEPAEEAKRWKRITMEKRRIKQEEHDEFHVEPIENGSLDEVTHKPIDPDRNSCQFNKDLVDREVVFIGKFSREVLNLMKTIPSDKFYTLSGRTRAQTRRARTRGHIEVKRVPKEFSNDTVAVAGDFPVLSFQKDSHCAVTQKFCASEAVSTRENLLDDQNEDQQSRSSRQIEGSSTRHLNVDSSTSKERSYEPLKPRKQVHITPIRINVWLESQNLSKHRAKSRQTRRRNEGRIEIEIGEWDF